MQCYSCFDSAMYQYHGINYKVTEEMLKYLESYKKLGMPVIDCVSCGSRKKLEQKDGGHWQEVFAPLESCECNLGGVLETANYKLKGERNNVK